MRLFPSSLYSAIALTIASVCIAAPKSDAPTDSSAAKAEKFARRVVELENLERAKEKLPPLKYHPGLADAARWMSQDMADHNMFGHTDHLGRSVNDRLPTFGYKSTSALGENVAAGQPTPEQVIVEWMHSKGHRANILNPAYQECGVGYVSVTFGHFTSYWTADFGSREDVYPLIINNEAAAVTSPNVKLYVYGDGVIEKMRFSNDGVQWSPWETYSSEKEWTLPSDKGKHTVYVELNDGMTVYKSEDSVELESADQTADARGTHK
jgi:uncharacterized protein YkwD